MTGLDRQGFRYKKEMGQHFLNNALLLEQIARYADIQAGDVVIEAGAGAGSLTSVLAASGAKVLAVELDKTLIPFLHLNFMDHTNVEIIQGDVMKMDLDALAAGVSGTERESYASGNGPSYKICANLPYNISSAFITMAFRKLRGLTSGVLLLQKEVADKLTALPGEEAYGLLAIHAAWFGEVRQVMRIEPDYFTPAPSVDSALVTFRKLTRMADFDEKVLWLMIRGLFNQRRKNLLNGLKTLAPLAPRWGLGWAEVLEKTGVDYHRRPETLSLTEFIALVKAAGYTEEHDSQ